MIKAENGGATISGSITDLLVDLHAAIYFVRSVLIDDLNMDMESANDVIRFVLNSTLQLQDDGNPPPD